MRLNIHVITDQHYRIYSYYSCPSSCPPLSTTLTLTAVLPLLFSIRRPPQCAGVLYHSLGRERARPHALARPTRWNSWPESAPPSAPAGPMTSWHHKLHRCTRRHVQSCPSRDAHVRPERASPRAELEWFQHRTRLSRRPRSLSTHAELAQLQHWPRTPPTEVTQYVTRAAPYTTGRVHDIRHPLK